MIGWSENYRSPWLQHLARLRLIRTSFGVAAGCRPPLLREPPSWSSPELSPPPRWALDRGSPTWHTPPGPTTRSTDRHPLRCRPKLSETGSTPLCPGNHQPPRGPEAAVPSPYPPG